MKSVLLVILTVWMSGYFPRGENSLMAEDVSLRRVPMPNGEFGSCGVVVEDGVLLHTTQLLPIQVNGEVVHPGDVQEQLRSLLKDLKQILQEGEGSFSSLVRVQINLLDSSDRDRVLEVLKKEWGESPAPALSWVQGGLPLAGVRLSIDAIAAVPRRDATEGVRLIGTGSAAGPKAAILPSSRVIHVAGQAENGADLRESTRNTLNHLQKTLEWQGVGWRDSVSIKCFVVNPAESISIVNEEISRSCGEHRPPVVFVEWLSSSPIEIEVVASGERNPLDLKSGDSVRHLTPPGMTTSPVYSRMSITASPPIYIAGLTAAEGRTESPESESRDLFRQLTEILGRPECGSGLNHLVKATYYCSNNDTSLALNQIRPDYYDPTRPPSASKAIVRGVGMAHRGISIDMIAVSPPR